MENETNGHLYTLRPDSVFKQNDNKRTKLKDQVIQEISDYKIMKEERQFFSYIKIKP